MISFEDFKKMELVVAQIKEVTNHPNADKLYILKIDTGSEQKEIVAGIRECYKPEELKGRKVVVIDNIC